MRGTEIQVWAATETYLRWRPILRKEHNVKNTKKAPMQVGPSKI